MTLFFQSLLFLLFFLLFYLGKFFFGIGNIHLTDIVKININLLRSCFSRMPFPMIAPPVFCYLYYTPFSAGRNILRVDITAMRGYNI